MAEFCLACGPREMAPELKQTDFSIFWPSLKPYLQLWNACASRWVWHKWPLEEWEKRVIPLSSPAAPSTGMTPVGHSRHHENIRKWLRPLCSNEKTGFLFSQKLQQGHKQGDGSWLHEARWCSGGLAGECERMLINDLPWPLSGYWVLQLRAMLPGHLLGSCRTGKPSSQKLLLLRNWSQPGIHSEERAGEAPSRESESPVQFPGLWGWPQAGRSGCKLARLTGRLQCTFSLTVSLCPPPHSYLGKQKVRKCWRCWRREHRLSWQQLFLGASLLRCRQPWHPPTEPGPLTTCSTGAFLKRGHWSQQRHL